MRKKSLMMLLSMVVVFAAMAQQPKYVFYMIGDGMGITHVIATERYMAALGDSIGRVKTVIGQLPYTGYSNTYSASNGVTDSAAGGTALAVGHKTSNGTIGMNADHSAPLWSIASMAKASGKAVGVITSVSYDNATPAAFYAHQPSRSNYYEIGTQLPESGFDFFGGSDFTQQLPKSGEGTHLHEVMKQGGYSQYFGLESYRKDGGKKQSKVILCPTKERGAGRSTLPFAIDRDEEDLKLEEITAEAIDFLYAKGKNSGFFLMVEGGMIDHCAHNNDAAATIKETMDFDKAVRLAYEFYLKHPKETLIVITADHETGGMSMGIRDYNLNYKALSYQKCSVTALSKKVIAALNDEKTPTTWEGMKALLSEQTGLWSKTKLTPAQEVRIRNAYYSTIDGKSQKSENMYYSNEEIAATAIRVLNEIAGVGWTTSSHSGLTVPVFAIGAGAQQFVGVMDNTDIPRRVAKLAKYKNMF